MDGTELIVLLFYGALIVLLVILIIKACQAQSKISKKRKQDKANGIKRFSGLVHVSGLNVVEGATCEVAVNPTSIIISCGGKEYSLPLSRITYVDFKSDINEVKYLKSSLVKGAAGAALFGVSGAVIGSAPKTKTSRQTKGYTIILYKNAHREEEAIVLCDMSPNSYICSRLYLALSTCINTKVEKVEL